jgi:hypothetical protein
MSEEIQLGRIENRLKNIEKQVNINSMLLGLIIGGILILIFQY